MRSLKVLGFTAVLAVALAGRAAAQVDPSGLVTPQAGPWLFLVTSYTGPQAASLAQEFVSELRTKYRRPAYLFNFKGSEQLQEKQRVEKLRQQQLDFMKQMGITDGTTRGVKTIRVEDQYGVLMGSPGGVYATMEQASADLPVVRKLPTPSPKLMNATFVRMGEGSAANVEKQHVNPFLNAFVVHNPTVQREQKSEDHNLLDSYTKDLNSSEPYSLLKCRKPYTLIVKKFSGPAILQTKDEKEEGILGRMLKGSKASDVMTASALQAQALCKLLRQAPMNYEAYVMHTRWDSFVTVGSFEGPDDPNLKQMQASLSKLKLQQQGGESSMFQLQNPAVPTMIPR